MKQIRLKKLELRNFKGFSFTLRPEGKNMDVYGENATGKTTIADAWSWLLFDKDSLGRADFQIKNLDSAGEAEHGLEHTVEANIEISDEIVTIKKIYKEIWTKKRGQPQATFTGHTTDYFINGVPTQKKDYQARIAEIAGDENVFRLLNSPVTFPALHWTKQRALLLEVCGDLTDREVIDYDPHALGRLPEILGKRSLDDYKKIINARRSEINKEIDKIPVRIDEVKRAMPDTTGMNQKAAELEFEKNTKALNEQKLRLQGIDTGGRIAEMTKEIAGINADLQRLEEEAGAESRKARNELTRQIDDLTSEMRRKQDRIKQIEYHEKNTTDEILTIDHSLDVLRTEWAAVDAETFKDTTESVCPSCGQDLPMGSVSKARTNALGLFNMSKAERTEAINATGTRILENKNRKQAELLKLHDELISLEQKLPGDKTRLENLTLQKNTIDKDIPTPSPEAIKLAERGLFLKAEIQSERDGQATDTEEIKRQIGIFTQMLEVSRSVVDAFRKKAESEIRIQELKDQEKVLTTEFERLEEELYLCELFIKTKVQLLDSRINSRFEIARFKLFQQNINGGIEPCCEITVNGIPYNSGLNNAARINAGLDVCRTLSEHYGLLAPIFIDNAESVCKLIDMKAQIIRLIVSEQDKALRTEAA